MSGRPGRPGRSDRAQFCDCLHLTSPANRAFRDIVAGETLDHGLGGFFGPDLRFRLLEQHSTARELGLAMPIGKQAVVANTHEAGWQNMQQEAANELGGIELHHLDRRSVAIVAPSEPHLVVIQAQYAII